MGITKQFDFDCEEEEVQYVLFGKHKNYGSKRVNSNVKYQYKQWDKQFNSNEGSVSLSDFDRVSLSSKQ